MSWGIVAGAAIGAVGSVASSKQSSKGQSSTNEPWKEVQPWLKENIESGRQLQDYYQRNPFNPIQQRGYENLLGDFDSFRHGAAPGLMGFANQLMGTNYQRAPAGSELGAANPYAQQRPAGLLSAPGALSQALQSLPPPQQGPQSGGLLSTGNAIPMPKPPMDGSQSPAPTPPAAPGVFQSPAGVGYSGQLNWAALNPWTDINARQAAEEAAKKPAELTNDELIADWMRRNDPGYAQREYTRLWGDGGA